MLYRLIIVPAAALAGFLLSVALVTAPVAIIASPCGPQTPSLTIGGSMLLAGCGGGR